MEILDEVTAQVVQGGMRGVSRARDLKPKRTVARRQLPVPFRAMVRVTAILLLTGVVASTKAVAQQPAFAPGSGPTVLFDLGHNSLFLGEPNLSPMTRLRDDGYLTQTLTGPFTEEALAGVDIVMILAPLADRNALRLPADCSPPPDTSAECFEAINAQIRGVWRHPIPSAFSVEELDTLQAWVERGGGLFLVFDIFPFPGAIEALAGRFGVEVSNGFAVDERLLPALPRQIRPLLGQAGQLIFRRVDQTLAAHPVTNGRSSAERVDAVGSNFGVYPGFPTIFRGLSGFFVGDLRKRPCGSSWKTRSVFQGAVGALCASTAPSASTGPVRVRQNGSRGGNGELDRRASSDCSRPVNDKCSHPTADLYRSSARVILERQ